MVDAVDRSTKVATRGWNRTLALHVLWGILLVSAACAVLVPLRLLLGPAISDVDRRLVNRAYRVATQESLVRDMARVASGFGSTLCLTGLVAAFGLWWGHGRKWRRVTLLVCSAVGGAVVCRTLKIIVGRSRPTVEQALTVATGRSFPSGHAMNSTIVYGTLFALCSLAWSRSLRRQVAITASALVAAIAASRVYLGVHYPSDVVIGVLLGLVWLAAVVIPIRHLTERGTKHLESRPRAETPSSDAISRRAFVGGAGPTKPDTAIRSPAKPSNPSQSVRHRRLECGSPFH